MEPPRCRCTWRTPDPDCLDCTSQPMPHHWQSVSVLSFAGGRMVKARCVAFVTVCRVFPRNRSQQEPIPEWRVWGGPCTQPGAFTSRSSARAGLAPWDTVHPPVAVSARIFRCCHPREDTRRHGRCGKRRCLCRPGPPLHVFSIDPESGNDKPADQDRSAGDWWALQDLNL
jgi:hypothetical protein